ncbi:MAG TPA: hypothetical protein PKY96_05860 [Flavobacteriales bacterium]|nr:hypothetical protein [Flavobacteriales bacterium]
MHRLGLARFQRILRALHFPAECAEAVGIDAFDRCEPGDRQRCLQHLADRSFFSMSGGYAKDAMAEPIEQPVTRTHRRAHFFFSGSA